MRLPLRVLPEEGIEKLGFGQIRQALAALCISTEGRELAETLLPQTDAEFIQRRLAQTAELKQIIESADALPMTSIPSIGSVLARAEIEGNYIDEEDAYRFLRWLVTLRKLRSYFANRAEKYPALHLLTSGLQFSTELVEVIEKIIGSDGRMLNTASRELANIRRSITDKGTQLRQSMERLLRSARESGYTVERELTIRNERLVLPISADHKGKMNGVVHDVSQSGQTIFIEPLETLTINNELRELRIRERNEVIRILTVLTAQIRPNVLVYRKLAAFAAEVDLLMAQGQLAVKLNAYRPSVHGSRLTLHLHIARHPLLVLQRGQGKVVPLNVSLGTEKHVMMISGPNAGGKSVAMKTVGLLQLMFQAGLLIPASADSELGIFTHVFVDIGDDQNLQNDLSTYSSHLAHMQVMLTQLNRQSLFLIDEFGTGTDPQMGGPIAEALLEAFLKSGAMGVVTTHYSNLKDFAQRHAGMANAAMQFDLASLRPTYVLEVGTPGSSYAFELAERAGILPEVIKAAREKMGAERADVDELLVELQSRQSALEKLQDTLKRRENELNDLVERQKRQLRENEAQRKLILSEAQETAAELIRQANARIEQTIREIREQQAEREATRQLRRNLEYDVANDFANQPELPIAEESQEAEIAYQDVADEPVVAGDWVRLIESETRGQVVERSERDLVVAFGELRTRVRPAEVVKIAPVSEPRRSTKLLEVRRNAEAMQQVDLRGMRVEAALVELDRFIDQALLAGLGQVAVIHGRGSGALRGAVRQHLSSQYGSRIAKQTDGDAEQGGDGQTIVYFK